ncbi:MAG TPA: hypothetical protein VGP68_11870 [Gemmataceae bacterium]|jgi:TolA-binding protein|nr:hypothetical protein [Gemmataceae bacterium]
MGTIADSQADSSSTTVVLTFGQLWQIPTFLFGFALLGAVWATRPLWYDPEGLHFVRELSQARRAVETGSGVQDATHLLADALAHADQHPQHKGELQFLLGSAYVRLAEKAAGDKTHDLWQQALRYFEQAQQSEVPDADRAQLVFRSARARYHADPSPESLKKIIADMNACVDKLPDERWEAFGILTQAYLKSIPPDLKAALLVNERQLQLPLEDERLLDPVRLLRGELLLKTGEREEARRTLERIGRNAMAPLLQKARYLRAQSFQEDQLWKEAAPLWEEIIADSRLPVTDLSQVLYCLGVCYQNLKETAKAESIWEKERTQGGEEALAAELYLAELHVQAGRFGDALTIYEKVLGDLEKVEDYRAKLVPATRIAATLEIACQEAERAGALDNACRLAKVYSRIARHESGVLMVARMAEAKANLSGDPKDFKEAGLAYEGAALALGTGPHEQRLLWSAAKNLISAKEYKYAADVIEHFIALQPPADGLSEAYFRLGEVAQAQETAAKGQTDQAIPNPGKPSKAEEDWRKCYTLPTGAFAGKAGVKLALALQGRNKLGEAEEILQKIADQTHPDEAQEEATFALANIIFLRANYTRAAQVWEQALTIYRTSRFAFPALYQLGECYRRQADADLDAQRGPGFNPLNGRNDLERGIQRHGYLLEAAAAKFGKLADDIQAKRAGGAPLTEFESDLLRKALFALAECRFDHSQFVDARPLFERLAADYRERLEGLQALQQLCLSYLVCSPPDKDKAAEWLREYERVLTDLPDSAFAGRLANESRPAFENWLKNQKAVLEKFNLYADPKK